jgi:hypothetical protein
VIDLAEIIEAAKFLGLTEEYVRMIARRHELGDPGALQDLMSIKEHATVMRDIINKGSKNHIGE